MVIKEPFFPKCKLQNEYYGKQTQVDARWFAWKNPKDIMPDYNLPTFYCHLVKDECPAGRPPLCLPFVEKPISL